MSELDPGDASVTALGDTSAAFELQRQGHDCIHRFHYQTAEANPDILEAYCYTDRISYEPGDVVAIHASSTASQVISRSSAMGSIRKPSRASRKFP